MEQLKSALELEEGKKVSDSNLALLRSLADAGFAAREGGLYRVTDPVLRYALLEEAWRQFAKSSAIVSRRLRNACFIVLYLL